MSTLKGITIESDNAKEFEGKLNTAIIMLFNDKVDLSMADLSDLILSRGFSTRESLHIAMSAVMTIHNLAMELKTKTIPPLNQLSSAMKEYRTVETTVGEFIAWCHNNPTGWSFNNISMKEWGVASITKIPDTGYIIVTFFRDTK